MRARFSGETTIRSIRTKTGSEKSRSSRDSGLENSKMRSCWYKRLNPLALSSTRRDFIASDKGDGSGVSLAAGLRPRLIGLVVSSFASMGWVRAGEVGGGGGASGRGGGGWGV